MKRLNLTFILAVFFPLFLIGQTNSKIKKLPDFMLNGYLSIIEKDTLTRTCFCFDKFDKQIYSENFNNNENIKYCKVFEKKYTRISRNYWVYELFMKNDTISNIVAEYFKIDNTENWLMKKYKNNNVISENKIKLTDSIIATSKSYIGSNTEPNIRQIMKTEIIN